MKKRLVTLFLLGLVVLTAACQPKPKEKSQLTIWYWGEQEAPGYKNYMESMVKKYEEKNPDVKVNAVLQESDTMYTAFRTAEHAGAGPDIQYLWGGTQALEDVWLGNCTPLDDLIPAEVFADIPESSLKETNWDGKQWGIPAYQFAYGITYNKEDMKAIGVDPEIPFTTWDEFLDVSQKLKDNGKTPIGFGIKDGWLPAWIGIFFGQQNLDSVNDEIALMRGDKSFSDPKYNEWLYKLEELKDKGFINEDILSLDFYQGQQLLESNGASMTLHAQTYAASLEKSLGKDKIGFIKAPIFGTGKLADSIAVPSQVYVIPKSAKNKEEAAKFLIFLREKENMKALYDMANAMLPSKSFDSSWLSTEVDLTVANWLNKYENFCYQLYFAPMFEAEGLAPIIQKMFSEDLSPADASVELDEALKKTIEQNPEINEAFRKWNN